tara:strand:- start:136 stop:501 length:366 start_codon:yes stop_codon:yes gene_type:complete
MANTFKTVTFAAEPASAGSPYVMYTVAGSTTTVVLGLILTNLHTSAVTVEVELVSDTANRNGANNVANGTSFLVKNVTIPAGSSLELLSGGKVVLETTDALKVDCSVADKVSGTLSIMEIT